MTRQECPDITTLSELAKHADYSLIHQLRPDPEARAEGEDWLPRQVSSGHYVPVKPTPLPNSRYVAHSHSLFQELGLSAQLAQDTGFQGMFSGDLSQLPDPMPNTGWATGYALSIYGTEYIQQCPFKTGNGYGDGRALSVFEGVFKGQRWEMQLKGAGRTPYCRGGDGRAVLRSSVREFLAQEHMHALGVPTSRSLSLFVSQSETVRRPWYSEGSRYTDPDIMLANPVAISTRVAPSFIRVGQLELFARRARSQAHPLALQELELIFRHLMQREYAQEIDANLGFTAQLVQLADVYATRLAALVVNWLRVGYCQGNFNSDNCAAGGFTLDYGPFGFCEQFDPHFQAWTGGGEHFAFFNQAAAARANFSMFCKAMTPLLGTEQVPLKKLQQIQHDFAEQVQTGINHMWATKLGMAHFDAPLTNTLLNLMQRSAVDYPMLFRELSDLPEELSALEPCFYQPLVGQDKTQWQQWFDRWRQSLAGTQDKTALRMKMKSVNPKYTWREWFIVPAYKQAEQGDYSLIHELQRVLSQPYEEQSKEMEDKYYRLQPAALKGLGGIDHYSCSS